MATTTPTVQAATDLGRALTTLVDAGITDSFSGLTAALSATLEGDTPERHAVLAAYKPKERE